MGKFFDVSEVFKDFWPLIKKFPVTLEIVIFATLFGLLVALVIAWFRVMGTPILSQISAVFISFIRGTPMIIQLYIVYYGIPIILDNMGYETRNIDKMLFVIVAYSLNSAGFYAEIIRGAIEAVPIGQFEASLSIGMTRLKAFFRVIIPQAIRIAMPSVGVMIVGVLKDTSMAFSIGLIDLTGQANVLGAASYRRLEAYVASAVIFILSTILLEFCFRYIEKKYTYGRAVNNI